MAPKRHFVSFLFRPKLLQLLKYLIDIDGCDIFKWIIELFGSFECFDTAELAAAQKNRKISKSGHQRRIEILYFFQIFSNLLLEAVKSVLCMHTITI